jgi:head-tail adaptor
MRLRIFSLPVSIERLQAGDNNGQPTVQATLVSACWAKLEAVSHQRLSSPEDSPALTHRLTIRLRQPVTSDCRVRATDGRIFKVHQARSLDDDSDLQLLLCEEITS